MTDEPPLKVVSPGEGEVGDLGSIGVQFKLHGTDTGGALSIVEHPFPVGAFVPPHRHTREDEYSIVTAGRIGFRSGSREAVLGPGGYITKPRGEAHAMWNAGPEPARMIEIISPAGFEDFFAEVAHLLSSGHVTEETGAELTERYGLYFEDVGWWPDVMARFGLSADGDTDPAGH
ncbi:MAG: cupin domain-containing protein [Nocardioides sp.]